MEWFSMNSRSVGMVSHHNLWPRVPQRVWPEVVMENHTHTPAVHGKSHTSTCALKLSCYIFLILHWFNEFFLIVFYYNSHKFAQFTEKIKKTCQMWVLQFGKKHTHTSALKLSLSYIDLTIFSINFAQKFQIFVLNSNFM